MSLTWFIFSVIVLLERLACATDLVALQNLLRDDESDKETLMYLTDAVRADQSGADIDLPAEAPNVNLEAT